MNRYLMTHSLLSSWLYAMKGNPYEDAETERDSYAEFLQTLHREPTPTTEAMQNGIEFEDLVTAIVNNDAKGMESHPNWFDAAQKIASIIEGGTLQCRAKREIFVGDMCFVLYGRLDVLKGGVIYDIKFTKNYDVGKYFDSTQHPTYLRIVYEAEKFVYLASNGTQVWPEEYRRDETQPIEPIIVDFIEFLKANDLLEIYKEHWGAK